jgi:hypothetical protein
MVVASAQTWDSADNVLDLAITMSTRMYVKMRNFKPSIMRSYVTPWRKSFVYHSYKKHRGWG